MKARTFKVKAVQSHLFNQVVLLEVDVLSEKAADAANLVMEEVLDRMAAGEFEMHPVTVTTTGPRGGLVTRFRGWESLVGDLMFRTADSRRNQMTLNLQEVSP